MGMPFVELTAFLPEVLWKSVRVMAVKNMDPMSSGEFLLCTHNEAIHSQRCHIRCEVVVCKCAEIVRWWVSTGIRVNTLVASLQTCSRRCFGKWKMDEDPKGTNTCLSCPSCIVRCVCHAMCSKDA